METLIDLLRVSPLATSFVGSYFWIRRNVWSSHTSIIDLVKFKNEQNEDLIKEMAAQKADSLIAWAYIFLSTFCQTIIIFFPISSAWNYAESSILKHFFLFVILDGILYLCGNVLSRRFEEMTIRKVKEGLKTR